MTSAMRWCEHQRMCQRICPYGKTLKLRNVIPGLSRIRLANRYRSRFHRTRVLLLYDFSAHSGLEYIEKLENGKKKLFSIGVYLSLV
jgi:hypothetical protein